MIRALRGADRRRSRAAQRAPAGAVRDYLTAALPDRRTAAGELRLLAVDLETTGLDPARDHIVSVGFLPLDGLEIHLAKAQQFLCRTPGDVGQSAVIHGITDDAVATGLELAELVERVLEALTGRVLLAHHTPIETGFLAAAAERTHGVSLPLDDPAAVVDTMELQARVLRSHGDDLPRGALRLATARAQLGLPRYRGHDALTDALACAELYLAQVARLGGARGLTLGALQR